MVAGLPAVAAAVSQTRSTLLLPSPASEMFFYFASNRLRVITLPTRGGRGWGATAQGSDPPPPSTVAPRFRGNGLGGPRAAGASFRPDISSVRQTPRLDLPEDLHLSEN